MTTGPPAFRTQPPPPLLRLSPRIRRRIYRYVGLASRDGCSYLFDLHGRPASWQGLKASNFHGLLLCCRDIYTEAARLLYSSNQFILHCSHTKPGSLEPLRALSSSSLASLVGLSIVLNLAGLHNLPLLSPASGAGSASEDNGDDSLMVAQTLLSEWQLAAASLSHITPGRLELSLICDIDPQHEQALDIAKSAVEPLRLLAPSHLKTCHIRLGKTADPRLQQVAHDAVLHACGIGTSHSKPSMLTTLLTLPRELRLRILEYTDLITPNREVTWSRQAEGYVVVTTRSDSDSPPNIRHSARFFGCWRGRSGLYCRRRHAAFSPRCMCWAPPGPLFLVCRTLYRDSQLVFFSGNRFVVHDFRPHWTWGFQFPDPVQPGEDASNYSYPFERLAISHFLREVGVSSLAHLRFLEVVFPLYHPARWPQTEHPAMQDWWETVDWLRDKINASGLTLRLAVVEPRTFIPDRYSLEEGNMVMSAYQSILRPLTQLAKNGLARFYADLVCPWELTEPIKEYGGRWDYDVQNKKKMSKESAERLVMGDRYESLYANNKEEPESSLWKQSYY